MEIIEKEIVKDHKNYASKGVANTALGLGIAGTALGLMNGNLGLFGLNGCGRKNDCNLTCEDKIELTSAIFKGRITELQERFDDRQVIDRELFGVYKSLIDADFKLYKNQRDNFDVLAERISKLETASAVNSALEPWKAKVTQMHIDGVATSATNAINLEAERRCCADNKIVNYANCTFVPKLIGTVTASEPFLPADIYNPLCGCCGGNTNNNNWY